ncbi:hypothetical protein FRC09_015867 [Ceratobasidium sp. 395]|nr:hypothetical protein FRC09_015867 [Ceratobasidium sp. 395]
MVENLTDQLQAANGIQPLSKDVAIIVLFGATGAGKTTFANVSSGRDGLTVGHGVKSCTQEVEKTEEFIVDGRPVVLVDCPGFDDTHLSDAEILERISEFLASMYSSDTKIAGLFYLHRITDVRFGGVGRRNFRMFRKLCGTDSLKNVVVVTNMWSQPPTETELARETELQEGEDFFQDIISEGAQMVRHSEPTRESAHNIIRRVLEKPGVVPELSRQIVDDGKNLKDTDAGRTLEEELAEALRERQREVERLAAEQAAAAREAEETRRREFERQEALANAQRRELERQARALEEAQRAQQAEQQRLITEAQEKFLAEVAEMERQHAAHIAQVQESMRRRRRSNDCIIV